MPAVGKKKFPYTAKGKQAASKFAKKTGDKEVMDGPLAKTKAKAMKRAMKKKR